MKNTIFFLHIFALLFVFNSCKGKAEPILDMSKKEAAQRLKKGDISFILKADASKMGQVAKIHPSAPFYAGLLAKGVEDAPRLRTASLFEVSLSAPSKRVRDAAAQEILALILEDAEPAAGEDTAPEGASDEAAADPPALLARNILASPGSGIPPLLRAAAFYKLERFAQARKTAENAGAVQSAISAEGSAAAGAENAETPAADGGDASGSWASDWWKAVYLLSAMKTGGAVSQDMLDFLLSDAIAEPQIWVCKQTAGTKLFSDAEEAAIEAHFAVFKRSYWEAIKQFRKILKNRDLFFRHPALISGLGRCFQYTGAGAEGVKLFAEWEKAAPPAAENGDIIRYLLFFYMGRMERQQGHYPEAEARFIQAIPFAPDPEQEDASIWYALDAAQKQEPAGVIPLIAKYCRQWNDAGYFSDILGELCRFLVSKHNWTKMLEVFSIIKGSADQGSIAKYAYILGRAVVEGYVPKAEAAAYTGGDGDAREFFKMAFGKGKASFYYRALSASYLGEMVLIPDSNGKRKISPGKKKEKPAPVFAHKDDMEFLLGFYEFGCASFALPRIKAQSKALSIPELRALAGALSNDGQWLESIRLIASYMEKNEYTLNFSDMALYYPRPFQSIIEKAAQDEKVPEEVFFGLIRTESAFNSGAVSSAGAVGLSQLMEATAQETAARIRRQGGPDYIEGGLKLTDPEINARIGASYLSYLIGRMDSPMLALLAYNGGPNRVRRLRAAESVLPDDLFLETIAITETREYGKRVMAAAAAYGYLYYSLNMEGIVADIFKRRQTTNQN